VEHPQTELTPIGSAGGDSRDLDALRSGAGICVLSKRQAVRVIGDDRLSFLHGMCSNDIRNARPGAVVPALFLTEHAHVIADFFAWIGEDSVLIDVDVDAWVRAREHLERLLVADDVEFEDQPVLTAIEIAGPRASDAGRVLNSVLPDEWQSTRAEDSYLGNFPRDGSPSFTVLAPAEKASSIVASIVALGPEFRQVDVSALEVARVENGLARVGVDTSDKTIALEAGLKRAISFDKGCYVGQETIERATARGGLKKKLYGLRLEGNRLPGVGASIRLEGKEVGRVSSVTRSPRFGVIGLAILHHSAWKPDTAVVVVDNGGELAARVSDIPFQ
jgi:folate-binding protein YgfZ